MHGLLLACLCKLWIRPTPSRNQPLGKCLRLPFADLPLSVVIAVGNVASPGQPILQWPAPRRKRAPAHLEPKTSRTKRAGLWPVLAYLLLGTSVQLCSAAPQPVEGQLITELARAHLPVATGSGQTEQDPGPDNAPGAFATNSSSRAEAADAEINHAHDSNAVEQDRVEVHGLLLAHGYPSRIVSVASSFPVGMQELTTALSERVKDEPIPFDFEVVLANPQPAEGYVTAVLAPTWLQSSDKVLIVLDFSAWSGPVYALITWARVTEADLREHIDLHADEPCAIFCAGHNAPIRAGGEVVASGTVFRFVRLHSDPGWGEHAASSLQNRAFLTEDFRYMWREVDSDSWCILAEHVTRTVLHQGRFDEELQLHAASAMNHRVEHLAFHALPYDRPTFKLVQNGALLPGIVAAARQQNDAIGSTGAGKFVFFDCRPAGGWIQFLFTCRDVIPGNALLQYLGVNGDAVQAGDIQVLDGAVVTVTFVRNSDSSPREHRPSGRPNTSTEGRATAASDEPASAACSEVFHHTISLTPETDYCNAMPRSGDYQTEPAVPSDGCDIFSVIRLCAAVHAPRYQAEVVKVELSLPYDVEDLLSAVQEGRQSPWTFALDSLIPVEPQPDPSHVSLIAVPEWAAAHPFVLIDTRSVDGRLFCCEVPGSLNREDFLKLVGLEAQDSLEVFLAGNRWPQHAVVDIGIASLISVQQPALPAPSSRSLDQMISSQTEWSASCTPPSGPRSSVFWVGHDAGFSVLAYRPGADASAADFVAKAARALGHQVGRSTLCTASARIANYDYMGQHCRAAVVVTEQSIVTDVGPDRDGRLRQAVFFDRRAILLEPMWVLVEGGCLNFDSLVAEYEHLIPGGFSLLIKGGRHEMHEGTTQRLGY
ncbi:GWD2 [Symbiodinium sp. CCMP2592]|nr:GWD2 [Symbiodinium sp. CCMP2592]